MSELTVIIPAYNEADSLPVFLPEVNQFCEAHGYDLIVVNDGSKDGTASVLSDMEGKGSLRVVTHKVNRGYGGAIKSGIRAATTRFVITIDADGQHDLQDVLALHREMGETGADMIVGSRTAHPESSFYRGVGKKLIRWFARLLLPIHIEDINSGIKIYDRERASRYIRLCPNHMAFSDIITMVFISKRCLVLERPVNVKRRIAGTSTINTLTAIETVREILNIVVLFNPMRVFLPISLLAILLAIAWGLPIILRGNGVSVGALLSFVTGILFFALGLLAEQLAQIRRSSVDD